jgi:hypothetical protein
MKANITITFKNPIKYATTDLGALNIKHSSGRSYTLDACGSYISECGMFLDVLAMEDHDTFPQDGEYKYDLTAEDIQSGELTATFYVYSTVGNIAESITYELEDESGNIISENLIAEEE